MNKRTTTSLSIAAVLAASALVLQAPVASAQGNAASSGSTTAQASSDQNGVPGVEMNVGNNASDRGLPGVEMNIGKDGDQPNINSSTDTRTLGAGSDLSGSTSGDSQTMRPARADRN